MSKVLVHEKLLASGEERNSGHGPRHSQSSHDPQMSHLSLAVIYLLLPIITSAQTESLEARRTSLAQLPLEKLLHVKQTLSSKHSHSKGETATLENKEETALPYRTEADRRRVNGPTRRGDPWAHEKDGKDGKGVSSIFQSTVTVLSFLAFGGYLLCLLCQSLRNTPGNQVPITVMPTVAPAAIISGKKRRKRRSPEESMIRTLHLIAEGYAAYSLNHTTTKK